MNLTKNIFFINFNRNKKSNVLKKNWDEWNAGGRIGPEPRVPFLVNSPGEAKKYFGQRAIENRDFKPILPRELEKIDAARQTRVGRFIDRDAKIKPR